MTGLPNASSDCELRRSIVIFMTTAVTGRRFTTRRLGNAGADPSPGGTLRTIASAPAAPQPGSPFRPGPLHAGHCQRPWRPQRTSSHRQELPGDPSAPRSRCRSAEILHRRCGSRGIPRRMTVEWFVSTSWWVFLLTDLAFEPSLFRETEFLGQRQSGRNRCGRFKNAAAETKSR